MREKPLSFQDSVKSRIENAVVHSIYHQPQNRPQTKTPETEVPGVSIE